MQYVSDNSQAGRYIELRAEMNVLVLLNTLPHPLNDDPEYSPKPVELSISRVPTPMRDDRCRTLCQENARGFMLTELYFL